MAGLKWFEQYDVMKNLRLLTQERAQKALDDYDRTYQQTLDEANAKTGAQRDQWIASVMHYQKCNKAKNNIIKLNEKLLKMGLADQIALSYDNIQRELNSGFGWSAQMLNQAYTDSRESREKAVWTAAEHDARVAFETKPNQQWGKLTYADQQQRIGSLYQLYLKQQYPEVYGALTEGEQGTLMTLSGTPQAQAQPVTLPQMGQAPNVTTQTTPIRGLETPQTIDTTAIPQGGMNLGQGLKILPDLSVWDNERKLGQYTPTGEFQAEGAGALNALKSLATGLVKGIIPYEYFQNPRTQAEAQYKQTLLAWAKANNIADPEGWIKNLLTIGTGERQTVTYTDAKGKQVTLPAASWKAQTGGGISIPFAPPNMDMSEAEIRRYQEEMGQKFIGEWLMPAVVLAGLGGIGTEAGAAIKVAQVGATGAKKVALNIAQKATAPLRFMEHPIETLRGVAPKLGQVTVSTADKALYKEVLGRIEANTLGRDLTANEQITVIRNLSDKILGTTAINDAEYALYESAADNVNNLVKIALNERINPLATSAKKITDYTSLKSVIGGDRTWAIVGAEKSTLSKTANAARTTKLRAMLKEGGYEFYPTTGVYKGTPSEKGFLVRGIDEWEARGRFGTVDDVAQETILAPRGFIYEDLSFNPVDLAKTKYGEKIGGDYTMVHLRNGENLKFSIPVPEGENYWKIKLPTSQEEILASRGGFITLLRRAISGVSDIKINSNMPLMDSVYHPESPDGTVRAFIEIGTRGMEKYVTTPAEQEYLVRLVALHEAGHEMSTSAGKYANRSLNREIAGWRYALEEAPNYGLTDSAMTNNILNKFLKDAHPELGKGTILKALKAEGLVSKVTPKPVKMTDVTVPFTNGWETVKREVVDLGNGQWEAQLVGSDSKIILSRQTLSSKPTVRIYQEMETALKRQKEIRYDTKTGKYFKVRKTIVNMNKTNWDVLDEAPRLRKTLATMAGFTEKEADVISKKAWSDLSPLERTALRTSAIQPPNVEKAVVAWNAMSAKEREEAIKGTIWKKRFGTLSYNALSAREQAQFRLAILTEQLGVGAEGKVAKIAIGSQGAPIRTAEVQAAIQKLVHIIRLAKPMREIEKGLKHSEMVRRAGTASARQAGLEGEELFTKPMSAFKGALPTAEGIQATREQFTADEIITLFNSIKRSPMWSWDEKHTATALTKLLEGTLPTDSELVLLEKQFGKDLVEAILAKRTLGQKAFSFAVDAANLPRALLSSWDFSAPLRQGALLFWGQPRESIPALIPMVKAFGSEKFTGLMEEALNTGKFAQLRRDAGLYIAPIRGLSTQLSAREESFMSRFAEKIPLVRHSERAYITYLNKLRADVFDHYANIWEGTERATMDNYKSLAHAINLMSGRGDFPKFMQGSGAWMNAFFFSPRFISSRVMLPVELMRAAPAVRTIMARNIVSFFTANMAILSLAYLATKAQGGSVEIDPRSTDFGKIKVGNTRIDFWGGFQPYARFLGQMVTASRKVSTTGDIQSANRGDLTWRFIRSKLSPAAGLASDLLQGETFLGDEFALNSETIKNQAFERLVPMFMQDIVDAAYDAGLTGVALSLPSAIGASVQTYGGAEMTAEDLDSLAQSFYQKNWNELTQAEQGNIAWFMGGLK